MNTTSGSTPKTTAPANAAGGAPTAGPWHWHNCGGYWLLVNGPREEPGQYPSGLMVLSDGSAGGEYGQDIDPEGPDGKLVAASWDYRAACTPERLDALDRLVEAFAHHKDALLVAALRRDLRAATARATTTGEGGERV